MAHPTSLVLLGLFERIPNEQAKVLAPVAGWIMLFLAVCAAVILIVHREGWRRLWMRAEDPRSMAVFRIAFGFCAMGNINGLWEIFEYLFTNEGIFTTDVARQVFAHDQFRGFGNGLDGDAFGFFDAQAVWQYLKGPKYSLLFFWDSPRAWWIHWTAFQVAITCMIFGYKTRYTKWIAWFLFHSIILRNHIFWEGTENVFRTFFFYLCLSKCGNAYSIDNWLRCRKLRREGKLSERDGPGDGAGVAPCEAHPAGLEAIYRRIPAWPRILLILQSCAIYCYTGVVKNGNVWWNGDAFYYALNLDHFNRLPPQKLSAMFGTTLFRVNAYVVHFWESLFPLLGFGLFVRFGIRERLPALSKLARGVHTAAWIGFGLGALALCEWLWPVHYHAPASNKLVGGFKLFQRGWWTLERVQWSFGIGWILGMVLIWWGWRKLRDRPIRLSIRGRKFVIDLETFLKWTTGRRVWLALGWTFHTHVFVMMNVGWFQPGSMSGFLVFLSGIELALFGTLLARVLNKTKLGNWIPDHVTRSPTPTEDARLPHLHRDTVRIPGLEMFVTLAVAVLGVFLAYREWLPYGWTMVGIFAFLTGVMWRQAGIARRSKRQLEILTEQEILNAKGPLKLNQASAPWAYGPVGRLVLTCLVIYQVVGVMCWLLPDKDSFQWRVETHKPFKWWLNTTQTTQGWRMFAPNPPRSNRFLKVLVIDRDGTVMDMNTDVYSEQMRPVPWIWYTRKRKINRRVSGSEGGHGSWYQKWHARYYCRQWQLDHNGEIPKQVKLIQITYPIPTPKYVAKNGPYDPVERLKKLGKEKLLYTATCETEVGGQLVNEIRAVHGLPAAEVDIRRWSSLRRKEAAWKRFVEREAKKAEREAQAAKDKQDEQDDAEENKASQAAQEAVKDQ